MWYEHLVYLTGDAILPYETYETATTFARFILTSSIHFTAKEGTPSYSITFNFLIEMCRIRAFLFRFIPYCDV